MPPPRFVDPEAKTGKTTKDMTVFVALASVFDNSPPALQLELVELLRGYVALPALDRRDVLALITRRAPPTIK